MKAENEKKISFIDSHLLIRHYVQSALIDKDIAVNLADMLMCYCRDKVNKIITDCDIYFKISINSKLLNTYYYLQSSIPKAFNALIN